MKYIITLLLFSLSPLQAATFEDLLEELSDHLDETKELTPEELSSLATEIIEEAPSLSEDYQLVTLAFELISKYD